MCASVHRSYFSLTAATSAEAKTTTATITGARSFYFLNSLFDASHLLCICSLFMHCCPFTNICLLVMPYLLFIHGNCVKINTSTPMRCEQTIQSTFISSERERERETATQSTQSTQILMMTIVEKIKLFGQYLFCSNISLDWPNACKRILYYFRHATTIVQMFNSCTFQQVIIMM